MARGWYVYGETLVSVKNAALGGKKELGLTDSPIQIRPRSAYVDLRVDTMGGMVPPDVQCMLFEVEISMNLIHFDSAVLTTCIGESTGGGTAGTVIVAGTRLGGETPLGGSGNHFISVGLTTTDSAHYNPYRFLACYLSSTPYVWPLGTEKSVVQLTWRAIPFTVNPLTADGIAIWDRSDL